MPLRCCTDLLYIGWEDTTEAILGGHSREAAWVVKLDLSFLLVIQRQSLPTSTSFSSGAVGSYFFFSTALTLFEKTGGTVLSRKRKAGKFIYYLIYFWFTAKPTWSNNKQFKKWFWNSNFLFESILRFYSSFCTYLYYYYNYMWGLFTMIIVVIAPVGFAQVSVSSCTLEGTQEGLKRENNSNHPQHSGAKCCQFTGLTMVCFHAKSHMRWINSL